MNNWRNLLTYDPIPVLLGSGLEAIQFFVNRDLLDQQIDSNENFWHLAEPQKILKKQLPDGSWPRTDKNQHQAVRHELVDTWRQVNQLVGKYRFTREHPQLELAVEYLFSCQTDDGDFRGILANQYATYYTGAILATIIDAGYEDDSRVKRCFQWLLSMRQEDGGWSIPMITHKFDRATQYALTTEFLPPVEPDRSKPFSHNCTGMVLRAFAAHPEYRLSEEAKLAADLLKSRFFEPDAYTSLQDPHYWIRFEYPFWWNNLVSAMDTLSIIGVSSRDKQNVRAINWLIEHQQPDGLWRLNYYSPVPEKSTPKVHEAKCWVTLTICRILKHIQD
ncbi:MAG: terpene cyclase/mutase family protein [Anaerolineaceae bacterium]|nr:terpene cyclase/mutase family protein [Anaerolineaceae bacterium]